MLIKGAQRGEATNGHQASERQRRRESERGDARWWRTEHIDTKLDLGHIRFTASDTLRRCPTRVLGKCEHTHFIYSYHSFTTEQYLNIALQPADSSLFTVPLLAVKRASLSWLNTVTSSLFMPCAAPPSVMTWVSTLTAGRGGETRATAFILLCHHWLHRQRAMAVPRRRGAEPSGGTSLPSELTFMWLNTKMRQSEDFKSDREPGAAVSAVLTSCMRFEGSSQDLTRLPRRGGGSWGWRSAATVWLTRF